MLNSKKSPVIIRNRISDSRYRLIKEVSRRPGASLYWIMRGVNADGTEHRCTSMLPVDAWATGKWEVVK